MILRIMSLMSLVIECHVMPCHYPECHYAICHYAECHYAECQYAECHYAECCYGECRGILVRKGEENVKYINFILNQLQRLEIL